MKHYKNILLASDFSPAGEVAAKRAAALARRIDARLTLLHVIDYFPEDMPVDSINPENQDPAEYLSQRSREQLAKLAAHLGLPDARQEVIFSTRSAKREIVEFAKRDHTDLIVLGSHGHRGLSALLGSTADGILHRSACDVLAVRAPTTE